MTYSDDEVMANQASETPADEGQAGGAVSAAGDPTGDPAPAVVDCPGGGTPSYLAGVHAGVKATLSVLRSNVAAYGPWLLTAADVEGLEAATLAMLDSRNR